MKNVKTILCLISLLVAGITNVWGAGEYTWNSTTKTLTIHKAGNFADGVMTDYSSSATPWYTNRDKIEKLIVEDGITHIGTNAFESEYNLVDVTLPVSLSSVGEKAFNYSSNTKVANVYYKGTPAQWVSIAFQGTSPRLAHPFGKSTATNRKLFFYGNTSYAPSTVYIEPVVNEIKQHAFYNVNSITEVCIPGTVANIRQYAFYNCSALTQININCSTAPTLGDNALNGIGGGTAKNVNLYLPSSNSGYGVSPWSGYTKPAGSSCATSGNLSEGSIPWSLDANGVLTIDATDKGTKSIEFNLDGASYPWGMFRRMVYKLKVKGEMTGIGSILRYHYGISEIIIDQTAIPTSGEEIAVATPGATNYGRLYNQRDNIKLTINPASLADESASNLGSAPWNSDKLDIALSDDVTVDEADYNAGTMLRNIRKYVEKNINLKFARDNMKNTYFNTFCSPIPLSADEVSNIFGKADIRTLTSSSYDEESQTLTLNFSDPATPITTIDSGVPYLIQPEKEVDFSTITFENLAPTEVVTSAKKVTGDNVNFYGTLGKVDVTKGQIDNASFLFLLADNKLTYATEGSLRGMRAYFILNPSVPAGALAHRPVLNLGDEQTPTAIDKTQTEVKAEKVMENGVMYIIKNGVKYSVMGERVR